MKQTQQNSFKFYVFNFIKNLVKVYKINHCKIDSIEETEEGYLITFYYVVKRQIFVKTAYQIFKNKFLLNEFSPEDATLIGVYSALTYYKNCNINLDC